MSLTCPETRINEHYFTARFLSAERLGALTGELLGVLDIQHERVSLLGDGGTKIAIGFNDSVILVPRWQNPVAFELLRQEQKLASLAISGGVKTPAFLDVRSSPLVFAHLERLPGANGVETMAGASPEATRYTYSELGRLLAQSNSIPVAGYGTLCMTPSGELKGRFSSLDNYVHSLRIDAGLDSLSPRVGLWSMLPGVFSQPHWREFLLACFNETAHRISSPTLHHSDAHPRNLLVRKNSESALLDWERALGGLGPAHQIGFVIAQDHIAELGEENLTALLEGYFGRTRDCQQVTRDAFVIAAILSLTVAHTLVEWEKLEYARNHYEKAATSLSRLLS